MSDATAVDARFGGFSLGSLRLALPMSALREVVSCTDLTDLPCPAACVVGATRLRGMLVPVVDLRIVLGRPATAAKERNVVIFAHGANIMGLVVDSLNGLFEAAAQSLRPASISDSTVAIFSASVQRADTGELVSVLSTQALSCLRDVPMVEDVHPARQALREIADVEVAPDSTVPVLLLECNGMPFAIEAVAVHSTLCKPSITVDELTSGNYLQVIAYAGVKVPVLDLLEVCGFGRVDQTREVAALIIALPTGYVALLISAVVNVVRMRPSDINVLPAFAFPRSKLFAGSLPASALPARSGKGAAATVNQYLVLDASALKACDDLVELSQLNVPADDAATLPQAFSASGSSVKGRRSMITFMLEGERATPLDQVLEILSYEPGGERFAADLPMLGLMVNRGRSIPVVCLSHVSGEIGEAPTVSSVVLVVKSHDELIGFAVRKLHSIEDADWEPTVSTSAERGHSLCGQPQKLALFESRRKNRMLPVLDLHQIAESLREAVAQPA